MKTLCTLILGAIFLGAKLFAAQLGIVDGVETQPLAAQVKRLVSVMNLLGEPFDAKTTAALKKAGEAKDGGAAIQKILDARSLFAVTISPEARVKVKQGPAKAVLAEGGWRQFLVKVHNQAGTTAALRAVSAKVAAFLYEQPEAGIRNRSLNQKPYWHIERARIENNRQVPVELIVNGYPVAKKNLTADGKLRELTFSAKIDRSSWVALRIFPSSHTNPVFVIVAGQPIRVSRRSASRASTNAGAKRKN